MNAAERTAQARVAAARRHHPESPDTTKLVTEFKTDRLALIIQRVVDSAPPLTNEQLNRLAALLRPVR